MNPKFHQNVPKALAMLHAQLLPQTRKCETNKTACQNPNRETASPASRHTVDKRTHDNTNEMGKQSTRSKTKKEPNGSGLNEVIPFRTMNFHIHSTQTPTPMAPT